MKFIFLVICFCCFEMYLVPGWGGAYTVTPDQSAMSHISYNSDFSCIKNNDTGVCYSCGGQEKCLDVGGCTSYSNLTTGGIGQPYSTLYVGCLGTSFCVAPSNGLLLAQADGSTAGFFNYISNDNVCFFKLDPTECDTWETTATTYYNFPFCRCAAGSITSGEYRCIDGYADACEKGYYLENGKCTKCPISEDEIQGTSSALNSGGITRCYIPSGTSFSNDTGSGTYTGNSYWCE